MKIDIKQTLPCELGVSLEILQPLSKVLSKLGPNSYVFKSLFSFFLFVFFLGGEKKGVSSEILQTLSKLAPNPYACKAFFFIVFGTGVCLEWLGDSPNSVEFGTPTQEQQIFCFCVVKSWNVQTFPCDFGVSLDILQTLSKPIPNSSVSRNFKKDKGQCLRVAYGPHFCFKRAKKRNFKSK